MARFLQPNAIKTVPEACPSWKAASPMKASSSIMPPIKAFREKPYKYRGDRREVSALSDVPGHGGPLPEPEADATAAPPLRVAKGAKGEPPRSRAPVRERPSAPERAQPRIARHRPPVRRPHYI